MRQPNFLFSEMAAVAGKWNGGRAAELDGGGRLRRDGGLAAELADVLTEWVRSESWTFGNRPVEPGSAGAGAREEAAAIWPGARSGRPLPLQLRGRCVQGLRLMLANHNALQELPAALTLLDALAARIAAAESGGSTARLTFEDLAEVTSLSAIVRLVLKCSSRSLEENAPFHVVEQRVGAGGLAEAISVRELLIISEMGGRVSPPSLPSPSQWAHAVLQRVQVLIGLESSNDEGLQLFLPSVNSWSNLLIERIGMAADIPPRIVAIGACVLGLVTMGILLPDEVRPSDVPPHLWETSLLLRQPLRQEALARQGGVDPVLLLDAATLAVAACCSVDDLRSWAFKAVWALQNTLF